MNSVNFDLWSLNGCPEVKYETALQIVRFIAHLLFFFLLAAGPLSVLVYVPERPLDPNKLVLDKKRRCRMMSIPRGARIDECLGKGSRRRPFPPCVVTKPPQIRPDCKYEDVVTVAGFEDTFSLADSGLTRPKIVLCLGSDGCKFKQLVKGGDDCRGDAVMEQVFHYVNELFRNQRDLASSVSNEKNKIITYNIVPLNPKTGVSSKSYSFPGIERVSLTSLLYRYSSGLRTQHHLQITSLTIGRLEESAHIHGTIQESGGSEDAGII